MHAAVLAWEQNAAEPARGFALYLAGTDVLLQTAGAGTNRYGIPLGTIKVKEQGPGGVSSLTFTLNDPSKTARLQVGQDVRYHDLGFDLPVFSGWVQSWKATPYAGTGRAFAVTCIGVEALLDWLKCVGLTIPAGTETGVAIQRAYANAIASSGLGVPLYAPYGGWAIGRQSGGALDPIGHLGDNTGPATLGNAVTVTGAKTLRETLRLIGSASDLPGGGHGNAAVDAAFTVGFDYKLRAWRASSAPQDYADIAVDNNVGGVRSFVLEHTVDGTGVTRGVLVTGAGGTVYGPFMDGSGIPGDVASYTDSTIANATDAAAAAAAYLLDKAPTTRGTVRLEENTPTLLGFANVRAGANVTPMATEPNGTGFVTSVIGQLERTFSAGGALQRWTITYGGLPASFASKVRRLTRDTLS